VPSLENPTIATDGDISLSYMQVLTQYLQQEQSVAFRSNQSPEQITNIFTDAMGEVQSIWSGVASFFQSAGQTITNYEEVKQTFTSIWTQAKSEWNQFIEGRDLDEPLDDLRKRTSVVVTLRSAQEAIEKFRIGRLKETVNEQIDRIENELQLIVTRAQSLASGAAAYSGRPSAGGIVSVGAAINELELAGSQVNDILKEVLKLIKLFDLFSDIEDGMEADLLPQSKPQTVVTETISTRNPPE
jgi:hypothetical protein